MLIWKGLLDKVVKLQEDKRNAIAYGFTFRWLFIGIVFFKKKDN